MTHTSDTMVIDHYAYLVRDTDAALAALPYPETVVTLRKHALDSQKAFITFVKTEEGAPLIELVEPYLGNTAMKRRLEREGVDSVLYHVGYNVTDFDATFARMRKAGWLPLTMPFEGLKPGCRASHLFNPAMGMIEIMEVPAQ